MIGKLDTFYGVLRDLYVASPEIALALSAAIGAVAAISAVKFPEKMAKYRNMARIARFCLNCPHFDGQSESCSIDAKAGETCALIDKTAGMTFTVTKN